MSHVSNTLWIEAVQDMLGEALASGNYSLAKNIIADTFDAGFISEARAMVEEMRNTPITNFAVKSPYYEQ